MPDLLTHVLCVYVLLTPLSWRVEWIQRRHVALVMVGTVVPDVSKAHLLVDSSVVAEAVGRPWRWAGIHRLGPAGVLAGIGAMGFERGRRLSAFGWLLGGVLVHLVFDLAVVRASGLAPPYLYPFTWWQPPSADLLLSSDIWPWLLTAPVAGVVWLVDRRRSG
jgi:hypothetical protein